LYPLPRGRRLTDRKVFWDDLPTKIGLPEMGGEDAK